MLNTKTDPRFYTAVEQAVQSSPSWPINSVALLQNKNLVMEKASSLLGYQTYLTQARSWKAARKSVPLEFEREVQTQATQALSDTRDFALAVLQTTKHLNQVGALDRMLDTWIAGVKMSGPVQVQDLWSDLANDPAARQLLKEQGWTDDLWTTLDENMKKLDGRLMLQNGKLAGEVKLAGQEQVQRLVLTHSASGAPQSLDDLLRRGQFERIVDQFGQGDAPPLDVVISKARDLEITDVILSGAFQSVQLLAQHKRKLQDTGLATYVGNDPVSVAAGLFIAGLILGIVGLVLIDAFCGKNRQSTAACKVGAVLAILGFVLIVGVILIEPEGAGLGIAWLLKIFVAPFLKDKALLIWAIQNP
jgi:hypothetical protein